MLEKNTPGLFMNTARCDPPEHQLSLGLHGVAGTVPRHRLPEVLQRGRHWPPTAARIAPQSSMVFGIRQYERLAVPKDCSQAAPAA